MYINCTHMILVILNFLNSKQVVIENGTKAELPT